MLPYCLSPKHAPDTLFILTEEDWRLCEADCRPLHTSDAYRRYEESIRSSVPAPAGQAASSSSAEPIAAPGADKTEWEPLPEADWGDDDDMDAEPIAAPASSSASKDVTVEPFATVPEPQTWLRRCLKPKAAKVTFPESLRDVVRMCTCAHRHGCGDFVWLCWDGKMSARKTHPSHGSTAIAVTQTGARLLLEMMRAEQAPMLVDILFKDRLIQDWWQGRMRASYVLKSVGSFVQHLSNVELGYERKPNWDFPWAQENTRGGDERSLNRFQPKDTHVLYVIKEKNGSPVSMACGGP